MHVLITGVTGFIGGYIAERMLDCGHQVTGISRRTNPDLMFQNNPSFELVTADLCSDNLSEELPDSVDIVYHYAAQLPDTVGFEKYLNNNVLATYNIFNYSKNNASKFVQASTGSVYGWDGDEMVINENTPEKPYTNYGLTKYLADVLVKTQAAHHQISVCICRYPVVYGFGNSNNFIENVYDRAKANEPIHLPSSISHRKLDFVHINDVVDANMSILHHDLGSMDNELFLIGSGNSNEVVEMANYIIESSNSSSDIIIDNDNEKNPPDFYWDISSTIERLQISSLNKHGI